MKGFYQIAACAAATLILASSPAHAQQAPCHPLSPTDVSGSIVCPGGTVKPGDKILVTEQNGVRTKGRLLRLSPTELALLVDGKERVIPATGIGRIGKRDSIWNGMLIGAVPLALVGGVIPGLSCAPNCGRERPLGVLVFGGIGAGVGTLVDAAIRGYSLVYEAGASRTVRVMPTMGPDRIGVAFSAQF